MGTSDNAPLGEVTVKDLLDAGVHFGHQTRRWNPKMRDYIFDKRSGIHIIDLTKSLAALNSALNFAHEVVSSGRTLLFVGTKKQAQKCIEEVAKECGQPYVVTRWLGGTLTNNSTIKKSIRKMRDLEKQEASPDFAKLSKKEAAGIRREREKLNKNLCGIADMNDLPGALFVIDINKEAIAVAEANRLKIPVIAMVDTNCNPDPIQHVIPSNEDSIRAIRLMANAMKERILKAREDYLKLAAETMKKEAEAPAKPAERKTAPRDRTDKPGRRPPRKKPAADKKKPEATPKAEPAPKAPTAEPVAEPAAPEIPPAEKPDDSEEPKA